MLTKLAWRNIWRNRRRSLIVLTAILIGLILLIFTEGLFNGFLTQMFENQVGSHIAHIEIHRAGFTDNKVIQNFIPDRQEVENVLKENPSVKDHSLRVVTFGLISSASNSSGIFLVGIEPEKEEKITKIKSSIVEGKYLTRNGRGTVIGKKLAEKLGIGIGDKLVVMASSLDGSVGSDAFRVEGIYETFSTEFDRSYVYIAMEHAQKILGLGDRISEVAIITQDMKQTDSVREGIRQKLGPAYEVLTYEDLIPGLILMTETIEQSLKYYYFIIGFATIFGIINTMLMSVLERVQEFGVLMAMGMKNRKLVQMILLEALFLGLIGTTFGTVFGYLLYLPFHQGGLDFRSFQEGFTMFGASSLIYPQLTAAGFIRIISVFPFISVLAAIYPAYRATRLEPVHAIRYV